MRPLQKLASCRGDDEFFTPKLYLTVQKTGSRNSKCNPSALLGWLNMPKIRVIPLLTRMAVGLLALAAAAYPLDWAVWRVRVAAGGGMGQATVTHFTVAELKGSKESYYFDGTTQMECSESLFPEAGAGACWWLARHPQVIDRY
jgi:hypothetical protein